MPEHTTGKVTVSKERWDALMDALRWALASVEREIKLSVNVYPEQVRRLASAKKLLASSGQD